MSGKPAYRRGEDTPPVGPRYRVMRLKALEWANVTILGTTFHRFWTHWNGSRTEPCIDPKEDCEGCKRQWPQRWKAYVHCWREDTQQEVFLECTALNRDKIRELTGGESFMRGMRLKVLRGKGDKTALSMMLLKGWNAEHPGEEMPGEKDPEETLRALFEFRRAKPDQSKGA